MFRFSYNDMREWFDSNLTDTNIFKTDANVHAWVMTRNDELKKFNKTTKKLDSFLLNSINKVRLFRPISQKYSAIYPNGLYVLLDDKREDWIIFVFPRTKADAAGKPYKHLYADHYSVPYDKNDKKKPVHFHETLYQPVMDPITNPDGEIGSSQYNRDFFADSVLLSTSDYSDPIIKNPVFSPYIRSAILDTLKYYHLQSAGGKRLSAAPTSTAKRTRASSIPSLERLWTKNKIQHVLVFSIKHGDKHCVTATVYDSKNRGEGDSLLSFFFVSESSATSSIKSKITAWLEDNLSD